jgi:hypothetical protein
MTEFHLPHPYQFLPIPDYSRTSWQQILLVTSRDCAITFFKSFKTELEKHHFSKHKAHYSKLLGSTAREKYYS